MTAQRTDLITGVAIAVIGAVYYIATFSIQETANIVTPRTFPAIVGIALIALGLFLAGQAVYRARKAALAEAGPGESAASDESAGGVALEAPPEPATRKVVLQFALFFVYLAILIPVGFLISTAVFLMGITSIYASEKWIRNLIFSIAFAVVPYIAFVYGLAVYLPVGILG
jgi:putative tricarboxylic transport membrane protein